MQSASANSNPMPSPNCQSTLQQSGKPGIPDQTEPDRIRPDQTES